MGLLIVFESQIVSEFMSDNVLYEFSDLFTIICIVRIQASGFNFCDKSVK